MDEPRKRFAAMMSGLDIRYDLGEGLRLLGRRMPDLALSLPTARYGSLPCCTMRDRSCSTLVSPAASTSTLWQDRVRLIDARCAGTWELPVLGAVTAPNAVLIRPDGYVAWVGDQTQLGLADALTTWLGPPAAA
jgi:aromatic ring hydroxylase-like protein